MAMGTVRWTAHALANLGERQIDREIAERALSEPEIVVPDAPGRAFHMLRYQDSVLGRKMLLRLLIEDRISERVVVTVYKTSNFAKYLKGLEP